MTIKGKSMENKVVIGGTGRAGTTFLMKVLTYLGLNTGFSVEELDNHIDPETLGGLEVAGTEREKGAYFIKSPNYSFQIPRLATPCFRGYMYLFAERQVRKYSNSKTTENVVFTRWVPLT